MRTMKIVVTAILLLKIALTQAQSPIVDDRAHRKYWYYRTRMINDFTKIGKNQGDCIVLAERDEPPPDGYGYIGNAKVGPDQIDIMNQYLMVLALEYKFLLYGNQSTTETLKEIYHILYTINRLDAEADQFWGPNPPSGMYENIQPNYDTDLNGFILREDMPCSYISQNSSHFNYGSVCIPNTGGTGFTEVGEVIGLDFDNNFSCYIGFNTQWANNNKTKEKLVWPHDKYYSLFIALMFINKYVSSNTGYVDETNTLQYFQDGEWDIRTEARRIADRCHTYLRGNLFGNQLSNWIMEYPDGSNLQNLGQPWPYSYALATMVCRIHDDFPWGNACNSYQDAFSSTIGAEAYSGLSLNAIPSGMDYIGSEDASTFRSYCQAGSNKPIVGIPLFDGIPIWDVMASEDDQNRFAWGLLMRKILYEDGQLNETLETFANPLDDANCNGPYNFGNYNWAGPDWASQDRNEHPNSIADATPGFPGRYPGVDYMLLHNMYYEHLIQENISGAYTQPVNLMDNFDAMVWPFNLQSLGPNWPNITWGVNGNKAAVHLFQNLTSTAHIYATSSPSAPANATPSEVEYKAGKEIAFMPGFAVEQGATLSAWVHRYLCSEGSYEDGLRQAPGSSSASYETDEMNTTIPIHCVKGPAVPADKASSSDVAAKAIESKRSDSRCTIVPNPNDGRFTVALSPANNEEVFSITVYSMSGDQVASYPTYKGNTAVQIDLSDHSKGIYLVNVTSSLGYKKSMKVSVQ